MSIVLHHKACGGRALNDPGPRRRVEDVQIVGGLLLARGLTAIHEQITVRQTFLDAMPMTKEKMIAA
jgi:hypothetical protein